MLLRNKPRLSYCGLTIILANPSRFDKVSLLSANGGSMFNNFCLQPEHNVMQCDVRVMEDKSPFLPNTKCIVLLGEAAMHYYCPKETGGNTLNEMRGSPLYIDGIPAIASYFPQDAAEYGNKQYEKELNEESKDYTSNEARTAEDEDEGDVKHFSATKPSNYAFWLKQDIRKCKALLRQGLTKWPVEAQPNYKIFPSSQEVINALEDTQNEFFYFDMETDYEEQNLLCFSFSFDGLNIWCVPILDFNYKWAYSSLHFIMRSLAIAISRNTIVAHNGAAFDFLVLCAKYHIPIYRAYDTMITQHRIYPDQEKSLGHCISLWTYQTFHKDTDSESYHTHDQMMRKLKYCGKDVFTMYLIKQAQDRYIPTIPGLRESVDCGQRSIVPYLASMLQGIRYDQQELEKVKFDNDRLMEQYLRIINLLIGEEGMTEVRSIIKGKARAFPNSNAQCVEYFHNLLRYPIVGRGKPNRFGERKPSLGKKHLYRLALKHDNPVIRFTLMFRELAKEYSSLKFNPWKDNENKIIARPRNTEETNKTNGQTLAFLPQSFKSS